MQLPWNRYKTEIAKAKARVAEREQELREAEDRRRVAELQSRMSQSHTAALRRELAINGWTELLQKAWGKK